MTLLQVLGVGLLCSIFATLLKEKGGSYATLLVACGGVGILFWFLGRIAPAFSVVSQYLSTYSLGESSGLLLKALAVGYLTEIGGDTCRDLGAESIARKFELCGRAELLLLSLPALTELLGVAFSLVG